MNAGVSPTPLTWTQIEPGEYEAMGEHAYYRIHHNLVTGDWALGQRLGTQPIKLLGFYPTYKAAKASAEARAASL